MKETSYNKKGDILELIKCLSFQGDSPEASKLISGVFNFQVKLENQKNDDYELKRDY